MRCGLDEEAALTLDSDMPAGGAYAKSSSPDKKDCGKGER